ncbi:unnamed protein product, partial [Meganyctiphanes norvegica]
DCHQIVVSHKGRKNSLKTHELEITTAIKRQNDFEYREGLISEPTKTWILPIIKTKNPSIIIDNKKYVIAKKNPTILGLNLRRRSFIKAQAVRQSNSARTELDKLRTLGAMDTKSKLNLIKSLVITRLLYPVIPLHLACKDSMGMLQKVQNDAIRFAYNIYRHNMISNEKLYKLKHKILPINQELHIRAGRIWKKIENGTAADKKTFDKIISMKI